MESALVPNGIFNTDRSDSVSKYCCIIPVSGIVQSTWHLATLSSSLVSSGGSDSLLKSGQERCGSFYIDKSKFDISSCTTSHL